MSSNESQFFSDEDQDRVPDGGWVIHTAARQYIPSLNFERVDDLDSKFTIELQLEPRLKYSAVVDFDILNKMKANKTVGFSNGIIVKLNRNRVGDVVHQSNNMIEDDLESITIVLEKTPRPGSLKNCSYNAFTLRHKIFYH